MTDKQNTTIHTSVLLKETIEGLNIKESGVYVDGTLGGAGHSKSICNTPNITLIAIDRDENAINAAKKVLEDCNVIFEVSPNHKIDEILEKHQVHNVDGILLDLGLSSDQLETSGRGFTFKKDEPLLMTMNSTPQESDLTAKEIVNTWQEESISDILWGYGEERFARRIAKEIVDAREEKEINTTFELVEIINKAVPSFYKKRRIHPATKTFQALRITVNNEIENLKIVLEKGFNALSPMGRYVVITFHSLEDRVVKRYFKDLSKEGKGKLITKKPIKPSEEEITNNPRARSAKLRIVEKI